MKPISTKLAETFTTSAKLPVVFATFTLLLAVYVWGILRVRTISQTRHYDSREQIEGAVHDRWIAQFVADDATGISVVEYPHLAHVDVVYSCCENGVRTIARELGVSLVRRTPSSSIVVEADSQIVASITADLTSGTLKTNVHKGPPGERAQACWSFDSSQRKAVVNIDIPPSSMGLKK